MGIIDFTKPETGSFLVDIIIWLVKLSSSIALGVVLFTVLLKVITLPFDYVSRASMRKNAIKLEEMRPDLEKLQRQYADNKELYNQKMMALYKKNGYSMFGACLPTIVTLVIFIIAMNGFSKYSQYQNQLYFYNMSCAYNNVVYAGFDIDEENQYVYRDAENDYKLVIKDEDLYKEAKENGTKEVTGINNKIGEFKIYVDLVSDNKGEKMYVYTENGYIKYVKTVSQTEKATVFSNPTYEIRTDVLDKNKNNSEYVLLSAENNYLKGSDGNIFGESKNDLGTTLDGEQFINDIQQYMSALSFREQNSGFLWVKNIWVTDSPIKHPIESDWEKFKSEHRYNSEGEANDIGAVDYAKLINKLDKEIEAPNGYFILVVLTAGISLLMQLVMGKSQKAQMELQTVDGQGAQTQKMMMWMMPIMMAIFAFIYTAAFSIYIILSSLISMGTTFLINFIIDRKMNRLKEQEETQKVRGRIYVPKQEEVKEEKESTPKKKKDDRFSHENGGDFLTGAIDKKKHVRGRVK